MQKFIQYTYQIVSKSLERYVYQIQQKEKKKDEDDKNEEITRKKHHDSLTGGSKIRSILRDSKTNSKKLPMIDGSKLLFFLSHRFSSFSHRIANKTFSNDVAVQRHRFNISCCNAQTRSSTNNVYHRTFIRSTVAEQSSTISLDRTTFTFRKKTSRLRFSNFLSLLFL